MGGLEIRICTSRAPAWRTISTILVEVVPRTMESSTSTTRLPASLTRLALCLSLTPVADLVGRLDEGAADIVVADDAELEGQPALLRVALQTVNTVGSIFLSHYKIALNSNINLSKNLHIGYRHALWAI